MQHIERIAVWLVKKAFEQIQAGIVINGDYPLCRFVSGFLPVWSKNWICLNLHGLPSVARSSQ